MRYAVFSDVHANEAALRTVLADVADMRADTLVCLGDVLGYGPDPVSTLERIYRCAHVCLAGNHDDAIAGRFPVSSFSDAAAALVARQRAALTQKALDWLAHLPHTCRFSAPDGDPVTGAFACAHGDFTDPARFFYVTEPADAAASFAVRPEQLLFVGHTHAPGVFVLDETGTVQFREPEDFVLEDGKRYLVNVGSVGYPRSGACRSFYCLYDNTTRTVRFRSVPFDLEGYRARRDGAGLDETPWLTARAHERKMVEVRRETAFGKAVSRVRHMRRLRPAMEGTRASPAEPRRHRGALVAAGTLTALLAVAGVWFLRMCVRTRPVAKVDAAQTVSAAVPPATRPDAVDRPAFAPAQPLSGGWTVKVTDPAQQRVRVDSFKATRETVFRLSSRSDGPVRFEKDLPLAARPKKVYYTVRMVSPMRVGGRERFRFLARVLFYDAQGRCLAEMPHAAVRSVTNKGVRVPAGAETARLQIDCMAFGTYDLVVPQFRTDPLRAAAR